MAYPYAAAHPTELKKLAVWEAPIVGLTPPEEHQSGGFSSIRFLIYQKLL
jgi:hypothetical protein